MLDSQEPALLCTVDRFQHYQQTVWEISELDQGGSSFQRTCGLPCSGAFSTYRNMSCMQKAMLQRAHPGVLRV